MRLDRFWIVTDPGAGSEVGDICFETSLEGLERRFKGGLTCSGNLTLFTDKDEAEEEAKRRLKGLQVAQDVARKATGQLLESGRVEIVDADGTVIYDGNIRDVPR